MEGESGDADLRGGWNPVLPGFLLLPGDGLLLVDAELTITWHDPASGTSLAADAENLVGSALTDVWPELGQELDRCGEALNHGPIDRLLPWPRTAPGPTPKTLAVRLFRTDAGFGIGLPRTQAPSNGTGPLLSMLCNLLNTVNEAMLVTLCEPLDSPGPIIIFANSRLAHYNGYCPDEILGRSPRIFQGPKTDLQQLRRFRAGLEQWQHDLSMEIVNYNKQGVPHWSEISAAPMVNAHGRYDCWVAVQRNITDRKMLELKLVDQASSDPLTGSLNRRGLQAMLDRLVRSATEKIGVIYADVDHLKRFNDCYGHSEGDLLLLEIIRRIRSVLRENDVLARVGGDEFVVVLPDLQGIGDARRLGERLQQIMGEPWMHRNTPVSLSISMGIAMMESPFPCASDPLELLCTADQAMYQAKAAGRQAIHIAQTVMQAPGDR